MCKIKILIGYHKPALLLKSDLFIPIHQGRALSKDGADKNWMLENMIGDDTGDNISSLNKEFCELTALYWAWKNYDKLDNPDYIGFMHYRRVFDFIDSHTSIKYLSEFNFEDYIADTEQRIEDELKDFEILAPVTEKMDKSVLDQFAQYHFLPDLYTTMEIVKELHPNDRTYIEDSLNEKEGYYYNMFIMKKERFFEYCEWIFSILFEVQKRIDISNYSRYDQRMYGFLAERLTNTYIYKSKKKGVLIKEAGVLFLEKTEILKEIEQIWSDAVVLCFTTDHNYVPYLGVSIHSLITHSNSKTNYDIFILGENLSSNDKKQILDLTEDHSNISIRFVDIDLYATKNLKEKMHVSRHFTISTYYRFFLPDIFKNYDKVLFLDSDIIVLSDVGELYQTELSDNIFGAATDTEFMRMLYRETRSGDLQWYKYVRETLQCAKPFDYFQAGVLLFNLKQMREVDFISKCFEVLEEIKTPKFLDQCILNAVVQRHNLRVKKIDLSWNLEWHVIVGAADLSHDMPDKFASEYEEAQKKTRIIHYSGGTKPWKEPWHILADQFWKYARETVFYERIIFSNTYSITNIVEKNNREIQKFLYRQKKQKYRLYRILATVVFFGKWKRKFRKRKSILKEEIQKMKLQSME